MKKLYLLAILACSLQASEHEELGSTPSEDVNLLVQFANSINGTFGVNVHFRPEIPHNFIISVVGLAGALDGLRRMSKGIDRLLDPVLEQAKTQLSTWTNNTPEGYLPLPGGIPTPPSSRAGAGKQILVGAMEAGFGLCMALYGANPQ